VDIPIGKHLLIGVAGEAEYLKRQRQNGDSVAWNAMLNVSGRGEVL
jgi:hypothetical protein